MSEEVHGFPCAIQHHYQPAGRDEDVPLYTGNISFIGEEGRPYAGDVRFTWRRTPRILMRGTRPVEVDEIYQYFTASEGGSIWADLKGVAIEMPGQLIPDQPSEASAGPAASPTETFLRVDERLDQQLGDGVNLEQVTFLIPNGWEPSREESRICDPMDSDFTWFGRTQAQGGGWTVVFDRIRAVDSKAYEELKASGGRRFTHVGSISRTDGGVFDGQSAINALERIRLGLCLSLGRRSSCVLPVGYRQKKPVWSFWHATPIDEFSDTSHFLDATICARQISEIVSCVLDFTGETVHLETLTHALSYYVAANVDVDVHLQASLPISGLQLLAFFEFVTSGPYSHKQWNAMAPEDRRTEWELRQLLVKMNVSTPIPLHFQSLMAIQKRLAKAGTICDALGVVIKMRNVATHPTKEQPGNYSLTEWAEAGMLARYWLGLALLHSVAYQGDIAAILQSRPRRSGQLRPAPWTQQWSAGQPPSGS